MNKNTFYFITVFVVSALLFVSCGSVSKVGNADYDAFRESRPVSILILPPLNNSVEVDAPNVIQACATYPLSEAGYYVFPVGVTQQMFRQNGIQTSADAHAVSHRRLREIFGADAALYMTITKFGAQYQVLRSVVEAEVSATLVDLKTGKELWKGNIKHQEEPSNTNIGGGGGGLLGAVVNAAVNAAVDQAVNTLTNKSYDVGRNATSMLLTADSSKGVLYGPRNPKYESD